MTDLMSNAQNKTTYHSEKNIWFLDLETNMAGDIFIAGVLHQGNFEQTILDPRLVGLAEHHSMDASLPIDFIDQLLIDVRKSNGVIAAFSNAEKLIIENIYSSAARETPDYQYCNLHAAAKLWIKRHKHEEFRDLPPLKKTAKKYEAKRHPYSLASVTRLISVAAPRDYAIGKTTKRINAVIDGLRAKKGIYQNLTRTKKRQATQVLKHNKFDVLSLPKLMNKISATDTALFRKSGWTPNASIFS